MQLIGGNPERMQGNYQHRAYDHYYHAIEVLNVFYPTLDFHQLQIQANDGTYVASDIGAPICGPDSTGAWLTHNYYFADGNGNITALETTNQTLSAIYRYDPFGTTISQSGGLADLNIYRFSSKEIHSASGMYYYGYRFYDSTFQRWLNWDPLNEIGFNLLNRTPGTFSANEEENLYRFVHNDPADQTDADGRIPVLLIFTTGRAISKGVLACYDCYQLNK